MRPFVRSPSRELSGTRTLLIPARGWAPSSTSLVAAAADAGRSRVATAKEAISVERRNRGVLRVIPTAEYRTTIASVHCTNRFDQTRGLRMENDGLISGWWVFAGVLLLVAGVLNIIYGIASIGDSKFFTEHGTYIISGLHTWGWVLLIIGVLELVA